MWCSNESGSGGICPLGAVSTAVLVEGDRAGLVVVDELHPARHAALLVLRCNGSDARPPAVHIRGRSELADRRNCVGTCVEHQNHRSISQLHSHFGSYPVPATNKPLSKIDPG